MSTQNLELHVRNNMISDALTSVAHDSRTQTIAFAGLWSLLKEGEFRLNWAVVASAKQLEVEVNDTFTNECFTVWRELRCHQAAPGVSLCENYSAELNPLLIPYQDIMRTQLLNMLPAEARATHEPDVSCRKHYTNGYKLVKSHLNQQEYNEMPQAVEAIRALNNIDYTINPDIALLHNLPSDNTIDYDKRYASRQMDILSTDWLYGKFHFKHTTDYRGRVYSRSVLVTPQGDSFAKASLNFANKKPLGEFGLGALAVHYANCSGHDKLSFADRIAWARREGLAKARKFAEAARDWNLITPHLEEWKDRDGDKLPSFEEYTAGMEFLRATLADDPRLFESSLICHQDATTSGFQFGAALLGDRATAALTNITGDLTKQDKPADLYGEMAKHLIPLVKNAAADDVNMAKYLPYINRTFCKKPIMTTGYGAGLKTIMKHIGIFLKECNREDLATVQNLALLQPLVEEALELTASSMLQLSETLRNAGKLLIERGEETFTWTTPDGFTVYHQIRDASHRKIKLQRKSGIRALTRGEIDPLDEAKMRTALPPNFVHSIDAQLVRTVALHCQREDIALAAIHDSFGTHAGTFKALNRELRFSFAEVMAYDWFGAFRQANAVQLLIERGDYVADEAILGTYMFS